MSQNRFIDATLRFKNQFTKPLGSAIGQLEKSSLSVKRMGSSFIAAGKSIEKTGKGLTQKITAPTLGIGAAAVKTAMDFESGMSKVQAISGANGKEMGLLTAKAKEMGVKTKFSATESAQAFQYMSMAGWKTKDMLNGIEGTMYLAGASGEDLATVSDIVTDSLTAFGLKAKDSSHFADVLAAAASNSNTNVGMMGETFKYAAPVAGALGYSVEDTAAAIGLMANAGIKSSQSGTALRGWMTRMAKPTKESSKAMKDLGITITDSSGKMKPFGTVMGDLRGSFKNLTQDQKAQYAAMLAGQEGMSGLLAITNATESDYKKLTGAIGDCNGMAKEQYDIMQNNLKGSLEKMKSAIEGCAISIGGAFAPTIKSAAEHIQALAEKFNGLSPETQRTIIKIAGLAAAIGPAMLVIGKLNQGVGNVIRKFGKFGEAVHKGGGVLGSAMKVFLGPAGIALLVIGALVAAGVLVYKNWDKIKAAAGRFKTAVKDTFTAAGIDTKKFSKTFQAVKNTIGRLVKSAGKLIKGFITYMKPVVKFVGGVFKAVFRTGFKAIVSYAGGWLSGVADAIGGVTRVLNGIIDFVSGVFTGNWKKAWAGVKDIFKGIVSTFAGIMKAPMNGIIGVINAGIGKLNTLSFDLPGFLGGKHVGVNIPKIPYLKKGTRNWGGGMAVINEAGGEIVDLPRGSRVYPHDESLRIARKEARRVNITINKFADTIVVREEGDIDKIADAVIDRILEDVDNIA
ncbi:phage tail tape measure protein [Clostridiales bacterium]|nr:phage tail tape measure protein [Clostridiales bacterium]